MKFPLAAFKEFCAHLIISSKDSGQMTLPWNRMFGTQRYLIEQIVKGLEEGCHVFVILKGRQEGITTVLCALGLFWHYYFKGMLGTFACQSDKARVAFRAMITMYHKNLPKQYKVPHVSNNREFLQLKNDSILRYQIGGAKNGGDERGGAIIYLHGTEISSWENPDSVASMKASTSETNPMRLQIYESTARGYDLFHDMWKTAKNASTQRAIFIGWWLAEKYRKEAGSPEYETYWDGELLPSEREWVRQVKKYYDFDIQPEQIAWWRWKLAEEVLDENMMMQEYPPTEHHAFIMSGLSFFSAKITEELDAQIEAEPEPRYLRMVYGDDFVDTRAEDVQDVLAELKIWEEPCDDAFYSLGGDPAYGSSDWADQFCIQVFRCYADRLEQVAEYCVTDTTTYRYAWVLAYLAGLYRNTMINLEVNGPGERVADELNSLRRQAARTTGTPESRALTNVVSHIRYFIYRRADTPGGGGILYHWKTNRSNKERMMNTLRDLVYRQQCIIHSEELVDEMKCIVREDGFLGAPGRNAKDDLVIAASLASVQYSMYIQSFLAQNGITYAKELERRERAAAGASTKPSATQRVVTSYLQQIGINAGQK